MREGPRVHVAQVGGSFGALFGFVLLQVLPSSWDIQPGVYALLCATAVLGGVFRSTFSLVVIVVEGTKGAGFVCQWFPLVVHLWLLPHLAQLDFRLC